MSDYHLESRLANAEQRHDNLYTECYELLLDVLPKDGSNVQCEFIDDAGNSVEELSQTTVWGDGGMTQYRTSELTLTDCLYVINTLLRNDDK